MTGEKKRYIKIPEQIAHDSKIKPIARLLYGEIDGLAQKSGYCYASNEFFASEYGCSTFAISRYINELVKAGYVRVSVVGRQRRICLTERANSLAQTVNDGCANGQGSLTERASNLAQTRKHNILSNNQIKNRENIISKEAWDDQDFPDPDLTDEEADRLNKIARAMWQFKENKEVMEGLIPYLNSNEVKTGLGLTDPGEYLKLYQLTAARGFACVKEAIDKAVTHKPDHPAEYITKICENAASISNME